MQDQDHLPITDENGQVYQIKRGFLEWVLIAAWVFQSLAVGLNLICYLMHPMRVDLDPRDKMFIHVLGTKCSLKESKKKSVEEAKTPRKDENDEEKEKKEISDKKSEDCLKEVIISRVYPRIRTLVCSAN